MTRAPKHPYTKLLRESVPENDPEKRWTEKIVLADSEYGEYLRVGCKFAGRCPIVYDRCKSEVPREVLLNEVIVKCHKYDEAG
ncbi:MAG: hypothetical protein KGZ60_02205 [Truepera sp.]|nr:hypothetical protein [Truepera sp.]